MAVIKNIQIEDMSKEFKKIPYKLRHIVYDAVHKELLNSEKDMAEVTPVDTGLMASSYETVKHNNEEILFGNTAPYAHEVEVGRPAGPYRTEQKIAIFEWAARKLQQPQTSKEVQNLAFGTIKKHEKDGRKPTNFFEKGMRETVVPRIREKVQDAIDRISNADYDKAKDRDEG